MFKYLRLVDSFPQENFLSVTPSQTHGSSIFGGIVTIIIYSLSFAFFIYSINDWQLNNKLPKITQSTQNAENVSYEQEELFAQFTYSKTSDNQIDPFDPENLVIQARFYIYKDNQIIYEGQVPYATYKSKVGSYLHILKNVSFVYTANQSSFVSSEYQIYFTDCQEKYLLSGQKCANESIVDQFYSQTQKWVIVTFFIEQFNTKTKQIEKIPKRNSIFIERDKTIYQENSLQIAKSYVDEGFLFSSVNQQQFLNGVTNLIQQVPTSYSQQYLNVYATYIWQIQLSQFYVEQYIEYPKIQEILADIGSIVSVLWFLKFIPEIYNKIQLKNHALNEIIKIYYSDFDELKIKTNFFGQIKGINYQGVDQIGQQFEIWKKAYKNLQNTANQKISLLNVQYEISRIQMLLFSQLMQSNLLKEMKLSLYFQEFSNSLDPTNSRIQQPQNETINILSQEENLILKNNFGVFNQPYRDYDLKINQVNIV